MIYQRISPGLYSTLVSYTVAISGMCIGYDVVVMNAIVYMPDFLRMADTNKQETLEFLSSVLLIGAAFGALAGAALANFLGRRVPISLGALLYAAGTGMQLAADKRNLILGGRSISGIGMGSMALACTLYITELSTSSNRGALTSLQQFFQVKGVFIAAFVVYTSTKDHFGEEKQWKMPLGVSMAPALMLMILIWFMPESPRWLMKKGREAEAIHSLAKFHSRGDVKDTYVVTQAADIKAACSQERDQGGAFRSLFRNKSARRRLVAGSIVVASAQVTAHSVMQYYTPALYIILNFTQKRTLLFQCCHAGIGLVGSILAIALVDRLGRKFLAVTSMMICAVGLAGAMVTIKQWPVDSQKKDADTGHYAHIGFTWLFYFAFNAGIGPISFTYVAEIFNTTTRPLGSSLCFFTTFFAQFIITQGGAKGFQKLDWKYYLTFLVLALLNGLILLVVMKETKGRTLEEMDDYWGGEGDGKQQQKKKKKGLGLGAWRRGGSGEVAAGGGGSGVSGKITRKQREEEMRTGRVVRLQRDGGRSQGEDGDADVQGDGSPA